MSPRPIAGWYRDPSGNFEMRYWDGAKWTGRIRGRIDTSGGGTNTPRASDPPGDRPDADVPTIQQPANQLPVDATATDRTTRAAAQRSRRRHRRSRVRWVAVAILVLLLGGGGALALLSGGSSSGDSSSGSTATTLRSPATKPVATTRPGSTASGASSTTTSSEPTPTTLKTSAADLAAAHAITQDQYNAVTIGTAGGDLVKTLGKSPQSPQAYVENKSLKQADVKTTCLYYNKVGSGLKPAFLFCLGSNNAVESKKAL
jgi:hypothetical protein